MIWVSIGSAFGGAVIFRVAQALLKRHLRRARGQGLTCECCQQRIYRDPRLFEGFVLCESCFEVALDDDYNRYGGAA